MRHTYPEKLLIVYMKSKVNKVPCVLSDKPELKHTMEEAVLNNSDQIIPWQEEEDTTHERVCRMIRPVLWQIN